MTHDKTLESELERWTEATLAKVSAKARPRPERGELAGGAHPKDIYTPLDVESVDYSRDIGLPGEAPYTRGVQPNMYRGRHWTMRQYAGFGTAAETNERYRYLLEQGQTGLSVAFDLPTQMGYDSDHPKARGEVGKVGVAIDSLADMEVLFDQIPLDKVSTSMTINATASILLACYAALAEKRGNAVSELRGTVQNDILKEYIARGTYIFPPRPSMRVITDLFSHCGQHMPKWNVISISGYHMREAGCDAVQEVAFTLANGLAYVKAAMDAGLDVDAFGARLSFFFNCHNNFLEEVAKFRAARRLWARLMEDRFGAKNPKAKMLRFHVQTAGSTLTAQQPINNGIRVGLQALAAVLGGCQSLHTNSYDEALSLPTEAAVTLALRTQQLVAFESGVADFVDPLGGSYAIETLTSRIEEAALEYIERVDDLGGVVPAIEQGFVQREIQDTAYAYQLAVESGDRTVVGVNKFITEEQTKVPLLRVDESKEKEQVARVQKVRAGRDQKALDRALDALEAAAREDDGALFPHILDAVRAYGTVGEISDRLRSVFGEYQQVLTL